jgi:ribosome-binding factor A
MSGVRRNNRVASMIQSEIGRILVREIADPQVQGISVTEVKVAADLSSATIYYHPGFSERPGPEHEKQIERGLQRALPFFRRSLGRSLNLRLVPELIFERDTHTENLTRLLGLIADVSPKDSEGSSKGAAK